MVRGSENLENFKLRAVAAAAGQTFVCVGGRSRQAEAAGVDESLIAWGWCAVDFFAHVSGFFTDDVVGCQKTGTLFSRRSRHAARPPVQAGFTVEPAPGTYPGAPLGVLYVFDDARR